MKIFFVIDSLAKGGRERRCTQLIKGLNEREINDIHLILFDDIIEYSEIYQLNVELHVLRREHSKDLKIYSKLKNLIKEKKPDIVFSWSILGTFWLSLIRISHNFNFVSGYVTDSIAPSKFSIKNLTRLLSFYASKWIVGNSNAGLNAYKIPFKKRVLIYNGFDNERLATIVDKKIVRKQYDIETKYVVTMVATFSKYKDYDTYFSSAQRILQYRDDVTFLAVGGGELLDYYTNKVTIDKKQGIIFTGKINNVESVINASDVCVLTTYSEGVSNFIVESMIIGKPVIATNEGGTKEIIKENETGYLIAPKDDKELETKINLLIDNSLLRHNISNNAREFAMQKFDLKNMCDEYLKLFYSVIDKNF